MPSVPDMASYIVYMHKEYGEVKSLALRKLNERDVGSGKWPRPPNYSELSIDQVLKALIKITFYFPFGIKNWKLLLILWVSFEQKYKPVTSGPI